MPKQAHFQSTQSQHAEANLAKELAFPHTGHTLLFGATQTEEKYERTTWVLLKCRLTEAVLHL
jgi:hypothetical protein